MAATRKGLRLGEMGKQFIFLSVKRKEERKGGREEEEPLLAIKRWELRHASIIGICFLNVPFVLTLDPSKIY